MARRKQGGSIYVSTDPSVTLAIGTPGVSVTIGRLGPTIYHSGGASGGGGSITTEDSAFHIITEDSAFSIITER
jgi:hypothetical protein